VLSDPDQVLAFNDNNIDQKLSCIAGKNVYKPWDCLSGIYQIGIDEKMGLIARPNGVTENNECVIMIDDYLTKVNSNNQKEIRIKMMATMAVYKAKRGIYIINKTGDIIRFDFNDLEWEEILHKIKSWSQTLILTDVDCFGNARVL
jgi:hypothetical protein